MTCAVNEERIGNGLVFEPRPEFRGPYVGKRFGSRLGNRCKGRMRPKRAVRIDRQHQARAPAKAGGDGARFTQKIPGFQHVGVGYRRKGAGKQIGHRCDGCKRDGGKTAEEGGHKVGRQVGREGKTGKPFGQNHNGPPCGPPRLFDYNPSTAFW